MNGPIESVLISTYQVSILSYMYGLILEMTIDYYSHSLFDYYDHLILKWEKEGQQHQKHKT